MVSETKPLGISPVAYCSLAAFIMAYGWGYRGTVGHEAGAMIPGALLGLALAVGSGRQDWHRRAMVVGLFSSIGFAWGGSLSYMEQTLYVSSNSFPDVLYGYTILFFLGALWAGLGGAGIGFALTEPRSVLEKLIRPFTAICGVFLVVYLILFFNSELKEANETFTVRHFHDGDWLPATLTLITMIVYRFLRPKDKQGTDLFLWGAIAWWIGYAVLTKFGGLRLGPNHRSESWGGVLGILLVVLIFLKNRNNRAALMMTLYGILSGGFGFVLAVFLRHPIMVRWGPFEGWPGMPNWRIAEDSFGFFMGLGLALGALRLLRGGLIPPREDTARSPLDVYAAFAILVALIWINFRRHVVRLIDPVPGWDNTVTLGLPLWGWYIAVGAIMTTPILYCLFLYLRGDRKLLPGSAFAKGALVTLLLLWVTQMGHGLHLQPSSGTIVGLLILVGPAAIATLLIVRLSKSPIATDTGSLAETDFTDPRWKVGIKHGALWGLVPFFLLAITGATLAMQEEPFGSSRKRFGPDAYWCQTAQLVGTWKALGFSQDFSGPDASDEDPMISEIEFGPYREVTLKSSSEEVISDDHRWFLKNQFTWLGWNSKLPGDPEQAEVPLHFKEGRLFITWPPNTGTEGYLVLERATGE